MTNNNHFKLIESERELEACLHYMKDATQTNKYLILFVYLLFACFGVVS